MDTPVADHPTRLIESDASAQRLRLVVPAQDDADQLAGWYLLSVYLQRTLGLALRVEAAPRQDTAAALGRQAGLIVFADAQTASLGVSNNGWIPVVRPLRCFEEVLVLSRKFAAGGARQPLRVACGSDDWLLPDLGIALLAEQGLQEDDWLLAQHDTAELALAALAGGEAELALVSVMHWRQRSAAEQALFYRVAQSHSEAAFPALCISADLQHLRAPLIDAFAMLHTHPTGQPIFQDLGFEGFEAVPIQALDGMLRRLRIGAYA